MDTNAITHNGMVRRWELVEGYPRCVEDPIDADAPEALFELAKGKVVRSLAAAADKLAEELIGMPEEEREEYLESYNQYAVAVYEIRAKQADALGDPEIASWIGRLETDLALYITATATEGIGSAANDLPVPEVITDMQFFVELSNMQLITFDDALAAVKTGTLPPQLMALIATLPTQETRKKAEMALCGARNFRRAHPLVEYFGGLMGMDSNAIDAMFRKAAKVAI